ncbi:unnamed protein product [Owenia fusiformis]|uniref:G protein pathway suppressor 2 n=1 Tax=Owenia fusiformis TaxID=6347 RepID=A0A8S4NDK6_OWEFU|nr:unnamed protein product [Owenia fusiformis]
MPALIERPKMTRTMYQALKKHIMKEREKKKQEQEQDAAIERQRKEQEMKKKREQANSLTLEQTKEQVLELEKKLEKLRREKHDMFSQLKKVLHHEDEARRRTQIKEDEYMQSMTGHGFPQQPGLIQGQLFVQGPHMGPQGKPAMYRPTQQQQQYYLPQQPPQATPQAAAPPPQVKKRPRSPTPPPVSIASHNYPGYAEQKFPAGYSQGAQKPQQPQYPHKTPASHTSQHTTYASQSGQHASQSGQQQHSYQQSQPAYSTAQAAAKYAPPGSSAFSSYPSHYAHQQKQLTDHYTGGYPQGAMHRMSSPAAPGRPQTSQASYSHPHGSNLSLQQLEHANKKSGFSDEKYQRQQQIPGQHPGQRGKMTLPQQGGTQMPQGLQGLPIQQQAPPPQKGSIVSGYPVRTQGPSHTAPYQTPVSHSQGKSVYSTPQNSAQRHSFPGQRTLKYCIRH